MGNNYTEHYTRIRMKLLEQYSDSVSRVYIFSARFACGVALNEAERAGREFSPIFWYLSDDDEILMTLWDMT